MRRARALLIDLDGVLVQAGHVLPGAVEGLAELERRRVPYLVATNTSLMSRATLAERMAARGVHLDPAHIVSALSVTAELTARRFPGGPILVLASDDARREFAGQRLLPPPDESDAPDACAAVVIGDAAEALSFANMDRAFRLVRGGARLIAMHRNPWWITAAGPTLDAGAFVVGLDPPAASRAQRADADELLRRLARLLRDGLRQYDAVGRCGDAELLAVLPDATRRGTQSVVDRLRHDLAAESAPGRSDAVRFAVAHLDFIDMGAPELAEQLSSGLRRARAARDDCVWV